MGKVMIEKYTQTNKKAKQEKTIWGYIGVCRTVKITYYWWHGSIDLKIIVGDMKEKQFSSYKVVGIGSNREYESSGL